MATFCNQCGVEIADETGGACANCGVAKNQSEASGQPPPTPLMPVPDAVLSASTLSVPKFATDSDLKGIGGWLILTVVALAVGPFISLHGVYTDFKVLHAVSYQESLAARPELAALILFEGLTNLILLITQIGLNILLYKTRRSFPRWMIAYLIAGIFFTLCDHLWTMHFNHSTQWTAVLQRVVAALVWIPYFLRSRRVELTFVD